MWGPRLGFWASRWKCPGITAWFGVDLGMNQFKAGKYVVGIGIKHTSTACGGSRLLQGLGRAFAFRSCGPGSIPTSGSWDFSAQNHNEQCFRGLLTANGQVIALF